MDVRLYTPDLADTWDDFVRASRNGTLFHTRRFFSYHPEDRFEDHSLLFYDGNRLVAVLPAAIREGNSKRSLVSHPGATFGGFVLSEKAGAVDTFDVIATLVSCAREKKFSCVELLRLTPTPLCEVASDDQQYALTRHGFSLFRLELGCMVFLHGLKEEALLTMFDGKPRNEVRQAERAGVDVRLSGEYEAFWPILERNLTQRHGVQPTHTLQEIRHLRELFPEALRLFGAYDGNTLIAGIVTIDATGHAVYCKYIGQDFAYQKKRPLNLLIAAVLKNCLKRGKSVLDLGVAMADGKTGLHDGIFAFKEGFGARSVRRESYTIDL